MPTFVMMKRLRSRKFALAIAGLSVAAFVVPAGGLPGVLGLLALGVAGWFLFREPPQHAQQRLYQELLSLTGGDSNTASRLIAHEASLRPNASRASHIRAAIARSRRDLN